MKPIDVINEISAAYDPAEPELLCRFYEPETGYLKEPEERGHLGDTLAEFIAVTVSRVWNSDADPDENLDEVKHALSDAEQDLRDVYRAVHRIQVLLEADPVQRAAPPHEVEPRDISPN